MVNNKSYKKHILSLGFDLSTIKRWPVADKVDIFNVFALPVRLGVRSPYWSQFCGESQPVLDVLATQAIASKKDSWSLVVKKSFDKNCKGAHQMTQILERQINFSFIHRDHSTEAESQAKE